MGCCVGKSAEVQPTDGGGKETEQVMRAPPGPSRHGDGLRRELLHACVPPTANGTAETKACICLRPVDSLHYKQGTGMATLCTANSAASRPLRAGEGGLEHPACAMQQRILARPPPCDSDPFRPLPNRPPAHHPGRQAKVPRRLLAGAVHPLPAGHACHRRLRVLLW